MTIVVSGFCIYFSPPTGVDSIYTPRHFFAGVEPISFVYLSQWVESRTRQNGAQSINRTYVCCFIAKPLFVLKTWEICFVVDLPAFKVLRQLTSYIYCKMCCHSGVLLVIFKSGNCIMNNIYSLHYTYRWISCHKLNDVIVIT